MANDINPEGLYEGNNLSCTKSVKGEPNFL